jgi:hypothetical protein
MHLPQSASRWHLAALAAGLVPFLPAQSDPQRPAEPPSFAIGQVANVTTDDQGAPIALGPDWEARFDAEGARFVAVLGSLSPELVDLRLAATALRQGTVERSLAAEALPEVRGDRVSYRRSPDVVEQFDATRRGLAHSLVLERPLASRGDLVVTIALGGSVAAHGKQLDDGTLWFSKGYGGVTIGALTAIDATGARCAGALRLAPQGLEWVVPAAFAERCAYPLLLDPLVGTSFVLSAPLVGSGGFLGSPYEYDGSADVAYDLSTSTWLVVWVRSYQGVSSQSGTNSILAQRFHGTGLPMGGMISLASSSTLALREPHVTNVNSTNRFVVAWLQDTTTQTRVVARAVNASDGLISPQLTVASTALDGIDGLDIGGESSPSLFTPARSWIVWGEQANGIRGAMVDAILNNAPLSLVQTFTVAAPPGGSIVTREPTISRQTSADGRLGVAWVRDDGTAARIRGTVIDRQGTPLYAQQILSGSDLYASAPRIDGGGNGECDFVCTWFSQSPAPFLGNPGPPHARAGAMHAGAQLVATGPLWNVTPANTPDVAWRAGKAYITCSIDGTVVLVGLDPRTCATCESLLTVASAVAPSASGPGRAMVSPTVCLQAPSGDASASRGVVVWTEARYTPFLLGGSLGAESPLYGRIVDAFSPSASTTDLGGGCGGGGTSVANSRPAIGNGTFAVQLQNPGTDAVLALFNWNAAQPLLGCGACQWLPFGGTSLFVVGGSTVTAPLPLPCDASLAGVQIDTQWTVLKPGVVPCALVPDFTLSNVLRLRLQ